MTGRDPRTHPVPGDILQYLEDGNGPKRTIQVESTTDVTVEYWDEEGVKKQMMLETWRKKSGAWNVVP